MLNKKILLVESNEPMRHNIESILSLAGLDAIAFGNYPSGDLSSFGLVITDIVAMAQQAKSQGIPAVLFTTMIPSCFRAMEGISAFDKLGEGGKMIEHVLTMARLAA